jgi:hypothetical protein
MQDCSRGKLISFPVFCKRLPLEIFAEVGRVDSLWVVQANSRKAVGSALGLEPMAMSGLFGAIAA